MEILMKKVALVLTLIAALVGNSAYAEPMGRGAAASSSASDDFSWGIALAGLAVIGTVVGITAAAASHNPSSYSH